MRHDRPSGGALGREALGRDGRRVGIGPFELGRRAIAGIDRVRRCRPAPIRALLADEPGDGGPDIGGPPHAGGGERGEGKPLLVPAGVVLLDL